MQGKPREDDTEISGDINEHVGNWEIFIVHGGYRSGGRKKAGRKFSRLYIIVCTYNNQDIV